MKYLVLFLFFLMIEGVVAMDYNVVTIKDCVSTIKASVTGTLPIDDGEYLFLYCTDKGDYWECPCDNYPIIFSVEKNAINNYTIQLDYTTSKNVYSNAGGSGGSGGYNYNYIINATPDPSITPSIEVIGEAQTPNPIINPINNPTPNYQPPIINNVTSISQTEIHELNIFQKIWLWIKKILLYKIW